MTTTKTSYPLYLLGSLLVISAVVGYLLAYQSEKRAQGLEKDVAAAQARIAAFEKKEADYRAAAKPGAGLSPAEQMVRELSTRYVDDSRSFAQKLMDYLRENNGQDALAIASFTLFEMADNQVNLTNDELDQLYVSDAPRAFHRLVAQILAYRGDTRQLDEFTASLSEGIDTLSANDRRSRLTALGKTRYAGAADIIATQLTHPEAEVVIDALLALTITGNERHLPAVQALAHHENDTVRYLVDEAVAELTTLSSRARIRLKREDIGNELLPLPTN
jgi:hypothetical protein